MFMNLTLAQQLFFFVLAVFLILLVFRILVKLKLMPVLLYMACANLIFPGWVSEHTVLYGVILAELLLVTVLRWAAPWLMEYMEDRRIKGQIAAQAHMARELGYQEDQFGFVVEDGSVTIKFEE